MSRTNIEIIRGLYEAVGRRDFDAAVQYLDRNVEISAAFSGPDWPSDVRGRDAVKEWLEVASPFWETTTVEVEETIEAPDSQVLAIQRWRWTGRDGVEIENEVADIYAFREGLIVRIDGFRDKAEAIEAAGLSE